MTQHVRNLYWLLGLFYCTLSTFEGLRKHYKINLYLNYSLKGTMKATTPNR